MSKNGGSPPRRTIEPYRVELISLTEPRIEGLRTAEDLIAYTARVSNPANQMNTETAPKLLKYLLDHQHISPFEMASMCCSIETSRGIAAQILRHRSFSFQEFSQRYAEVQERKTYPARRQDTKNRQNSIDDLPEPSQAWFKDAQDSVWDHCMSLYKKALDSGVAKELARFLLPLSTSTKLYMSGTIRSWIHYLQLRTANGTQREHQEIAVAIRDQIFVPNFPETSRALSWL